MNVKAVIGCLLAAAPAWADPFAIHCERDRYYEGEEAICQTELPECVGKGYEADWIIGWDVLGKSLKSESRKLKGTHLKENFTLRLPEKISSISPVDITAREMGGMGTLCGVQLVVGGSGPVLRGRSTIQVYPKSPAFYIDPQKLTHKRIAVDDTSGKLKKELDYLKIPYDSVRMADMPSKRYDLFILARSTPTAEPIILGNGTRVIQVLVDIHLDDDPQTRWLLAQRIRAVFKSQNDAKDLAPEPSNP